MTEILKRAKGFDDFIHLFILCCLVTLELNTDDRIFTDTPRHRVCNSEFISDALIAFVKIILPRIQNRYFCLLFPYFIWNDFLPIFCLLRLNWRIKFLAKTNTTSTKIKNKTGKLYNCEYITHTWGTFRLNL